MKVPIYGYEFRRKQCEIRPSSYEFRYINQIYELKTQ